MKSRSPLLLEDSEGCIPAAPETHPGLTWRGGGLHTDQGRSAEPRSTAHGPVRIPEASLQAWPLRAIALAAG